MGYTWWTSVFRQRRCASSAIRIEDMNSPASPGPEARHQSPPGRSQVLAVAVVGGLSLLVVVFYQWAVRLMAGTNPALGVPPLWTYAIWIAGTLISAGILWWHQRHPIAVFVSVFVLHLIGSVLIGNGGLGGVALPLWFSVYALAAFAPLLTAVILGMSAWFVATIVQLLVVAASGLSLSGPEMAFAALNQGFFFLASFMIGVGMRMQRQRTHDAAERASLAEARTRAEAAEAVTRERNRMARELHDLAAHQIMDVLLTTRAALLTGPDPVLEEIDQKTAKALESVRSVVGALREADTDTSDDELLADAVVRTIEQLSRERGLQVSRRIDIGYEPASAIRVTTISVLTEALVNAATHAPGASVTVVLSSDASSLRLEVRNPLFAGADRGIGASHDAGALPPPRGETERGLTPPIHQLDAVRVRAGTRHRSADSGYGLLGAAERAHILSGRLTAGAADDGDWVLALTLPTTSMPTEVTL